SRHIPDAEERPKALAPPYAVAIALGSAAVVALYLTGYLQQEGYLFEFHFAQAH
ncbi:MAG: hypothetical protein JRH20_19570, partial [Deltaproteobacteria bacterium]|nr:hypothetical protein [Deltaproteobacteria bacterium]